MPSKSSAWERWNTHESTLVEQEVFGTVLRLSQNPSSEHLGTTVWDASIVMAKYLEKNVRKGEFSRPRASGKRCIELGAGMGLGGMAMAMIGADVVLTDVPAVLPLLRKNFEANLSPAAVRGSGASWARCLGHVSVSELDWTRPEQVVPLAPPFDYVLAADCIYHEDIIEHLLRTILDVTHSKSVILLANELRSHSVQERFVELFSKEFVVKAVPHSKQHPMFQHPAILLYVLKRRKGCKAGQGDAMGQEGEEEEEEEEGVEGAATSAAGAAEAAADVAGAAGSSVGSAVAATASKGGGSSILVEEGLQGLQLSGAAAAAAADGGEQDEAEHQGQGQPSLNVDWETRRQGVMIARALADVEVPSSG